MTPTARALVTGSMCAASVRCYAVALMADVLLVDLDECRLPLRHSHHRYRIDGPNGVQTLTVPLVGSTNNMVTPLRDVLISEHGNWRRLHWGALYSAYGRSPYFDYVADDLSRLINGNQRFLHDFNAQMHALVTDFMDLPVNVRYVSGVGEHDNDQVIDLRGRIGMKHPDNLPVSNVPYHQMWTADQGFIPDLSILDLMMNEGREGIFSLMAMARELTSSIEQIKHR